MDGLGYIILESKNAHPDYQQPFWSLVELLMKEDRLWTQRAHGKTWAAIVKCKMTMDITHSFIRDDNFKAATLTMMKHGNIADDLKVAFRRRKAEFQQAMKLYQQCIKAMQNWLSEQLTDEDVATARSAVEK